VEESMSGLYNILFGQSPIADELLAIVGLTRDDCGRFRDCYLNEVGSEVHVYTRNGGGNRDGYMPDFSGDPLYLGDEDDDFDCTYATIRFRVPEEYLPVTRKLAELNKSESGGQKWDRLFEAMTKGETTPEIERGIRALEPLFAKLKGLEP
jgi:hypothetical protein